MKKLVDRISSVFSRVAGVGICSLLPYLSGCVEPPKNAQFYTKEELEGQQTKTALLRASGLLFGLAGINAPTPVNAARAAVVAQGAHYLADDQSRMAAAQVGRSGGNPQQNYSAQVQQQTPRVYSTLLIDRDGDRQFEELRPQTSFGEYDHIGFVAENFPPGSLLTMVFREKEGKTHFSYDSRASGIGYLNLLPIRITEEDRKDNEGIKEYHIEFFQNGVRFPDMLTIFVDYKTKN